MVNGVVGLFYFNLMWIWVCGVNVIVNFCCGINCFVFEGNVGGVF